MPDLYSKRRRASFGRALIVLVVIFGYASANSQGTDAATRLRLAQGLEQAGDFDRAAAVYRELLMRDSSNFVYLEGLQRMYMQLKRYDEARALIQHRLVARPTDVNLHALLGSVYYKAGREKDAAAEWDKAISANPGNSNYYRIIAGILMENRLLDKTAELYRRARAACSDPDLFTIELAQLLMVTMDYSGATREFIHWLALNPSQLGYVQGRMSTFTGKEEARAAAVDVVRNALDHNEDPRLYELLGWLYLEGKNLSEALEVYRTIDRISHSQGASMYAFAERAFKEGYFDLAATAYLEAINTPVIAAKLPYAMYGYANSLKELGARADTLGGMLTPGARASAESRQQYSNAIAYYHRIIERFPRSEFSAKSYYQIGLIEYLIYFDLDGALTSFEKVGGEISGISTLRYDVSLKKGMVYLTKGDTTHAAAQFIAVAAAPDALPDQSDEANYRLAELDYFGGNFQQAIERLTGITLNLKADYANDALQLQSFIQGNSAAAPKALVQFGYADFLAAQRKNTEAIAVLNTILEQYPQSMLVDDAVMRIAALQTDAGLYSQALATYDRLFVRYKETSIALDRAKFRVAEIYQFGLKDTARAIAAYERLLAEHPQSVWNTTARKRIRQLRGDVF